MEMQNWDEAWDEERESRKKINPNSICTFGVKPLDDAFVGILKNDLIAIGADSGVGKSELCLNMAIHNVKNGKKVALYFIEGGAEEAIARIKWQAITSKYYKKGCLEVTLDYRKWRMNNLNSKLIDDLENECKNELAELFSNRLSIYKIDQGFKIEDLINSLGWFTKQKVEYGIYVNDGFDVDLIIIDHLQYFTLSNEKSEYQEMSEILKVVKQITDFHKIPVILVSHLRKKDKDRGLPGQDDFHGMVKLN